MPGLQSGCRVTPFLIITNYISNTSHAFCSYHYIFQYIMFLGRLFLQRLPNAVDFTRIEIRLADAGFRRWAARSGDMMSFFKFEHGQVPIGWTGQIRYEESTPG